MLQIHRITLLWNLYWKMKSKTKRKWSTNRKNANSDDKREKLWNNFNKRKPWITALVIALAAHNYRMIYNNTTTTTTTISNKKQISTNQIYHSFYFRDLIKNFHENGFERIEQCIEHSACNIFYLGFCSFQHCIYEETFDMKYSTLFFIHLMWSNW